MVGTRGAADGRTGILVVEDDYLVGLEAEAALAEAGFAVLSIVATAQEAIAAAASVRPDLVLMDIRLLGEADGVDAALEIYRTLGIRSLFASANVEPEIRARAAPSRPLGWLAKPYGARMLVEAVSAAAEEAGARSRP